ncbi:unnamed protein product [Ectocarpus sp. CCAP 1310/34]|nr:unnamed protein product [Ectocarpus sp. CCAP 1310/34]
MAFFVSMTADCGPTAEEHVRHMPGPSGTGTGGYQARKDADSKPGKQRTNSTRHKQMRDTKRLRKPWRRQQLTEAHPRLTLSGRPAEQTASTSYCCRDESLCTRRGGG